MKIILLQIMLSMVFFLITPLASPQGKEFERTRSFDWQKPLVGEDAEVEYKLAIGDQINVSVWRNPELSGTRTINPDGKVSFPLIGTIKASDLTIEEFRENLREKLSFYVRYPDITVTVESVAGQKVIILGEVKYPGIYTFQGQLHLMEAIGLAGDVTKDAKRESIIIVSNNFTEYPVARRVNLFKALREGTSDPAFMLHGNDVLYIPRTFVADVTNFAKDISAIMLGSDRVTTGLFDWRREIRWLYRRNISARRSID